MGQSLDSMRQNQSKDELLHQLVHSGNVGAIKALVRGGGANLEFIDKDGKTPLIVACMDSGLFSVANALVEMGANVNAYRPGRHAGTPLHHAAKRGLDQTLNLLLCNGANALVRNDDCQTALDVARIKGHANVVRAIENHICYFSGWLREFCGPGFLEALAPQLLSRKIWVVVIPCGSSNPMKPMRLELAVYTTTQDAQPRTIIALWKAKIEKPKFHQSDPGLTIFDQSTKCRYKFASANEGDKQQLHKLHDACNGSPQVMPLAHQDTHTTVPEFTRENSAEAVELAMAMSASLQSAHQDTHTTVPEFTRENSAEAVELAMAISASLQSAAGDRPPLPSIHRNSDAGNPNDWGNSVDGDGHNGWGSAVGSTHSEASTSRWMDGEAKEDCNGWGVPSSGSIGNQIAVQAHDNTAPVVRTSEITAPNLPSPSAPPIPDEEGPIHYPSIDFSPVDLSALGVEHEASVMNDMMKDGDGSSLCIICWEAPIEGACIPCGHMAGCMECLNEIKAKKGVCPVCRAKISQVVRLYAV